MADGILPPPGAILLPGSDSRRAASPARRGRMPRPPARDNRPVGRDILDPRDYLPGRERQFAARSILASFPDAGSARAAARALRQAGYEHVQVDKVSLFPAERGSLRQQPWPTTLTEEPDKDRRGLVAQDPSVSGSALGGEEPLGGHHYLLTVATDPDRFRPALAIIRRHGGNVDTGGPR